MLFSSNPRRDDKINCAVISRTTHQKITKILEKNVQKIESSRTVQLPATFSTISYGKSFVLSREKNDHIIR